MYSNLTFFTFIIGISIFIWWITLQQSHSILGNWAEENGYEVLEARYCYFFLGPFFLRTTKSQSVYRFVLRKQGTGEIKSGWARCGNWFWGVLGSQEIKVIWDKNPDTFDLKPKNKLKPKNEEFAS